MNHQQQRMPQFGGLRMATPRQNFLPNMSQRLMQQKQQQQQQQFQVPQQPQFTKPVVDVTKDTEKLQNDQQRLASLHSKLHKEAEKIRHWKSEKEMELKQKERSLSEAIQTIDSLRKSIIELQFQNEEFSTKLHDKELEKSETEQKLHTVREMANVLRDQMVQLEDRILKGEQDKEDTVQTNQKMLSENQSIMLKFQELDINQTTMTVRNMKQIKQLEGKHETKANDLQSNIRHLENQVIALMQTKTNQEESINEYLIQLKSNEDMITKNRIDLEKNQDKIQSAEQVMFCQDQNLKKLNTVFEEASTKLKDTDQLLLETTTKLKEAENKSETNRLHAEEVQTIYSKEINSLQEDIKQLNEIINKNIYETENLKKMKKEMEGNISNLQIEISLDKSKEKELQTQIEDIQNKLQQLEDKISQLDSELSSCKTQLETATEEIAEITNKSEELSNQLKLSIDNMNKVIGEKNSLDNSFQEAQHHIKQLLEKQEENEKVMNNYMNTLTTAQNEKDQRILEMKKLTETIAQLGKHGLEFRNENLNFQQKINTLEKEIIRKESVINEHQTKLNNVKEEMEKLQETITDQKQHLDLLSEKEQENAECMKTELADRERKAEDLGNKTKSLQTQISEKTKQLKAIEKENKSIKTQIKNKTEKNNKLEDQINDMKNKTKSLQEKIEEIEKALQTCQMEMQMAKENFDAEQKDFCSTLEQYKLENDKIVESHVNENNGLKQEAEEMKSELKKEITSLRVQIEENDSMFALQNKRVAELELGVCEKDTQEMKISELQRLLHDATSDINLKDQKVNDLQKELEVTLEKLEEEKQKRERLEIKSNQSERRNHDRVVPTTPNIDSRKANPKTPSSILRMSTSKRDKRVLFAGVEGESDSSMDTEEQDEHPVKQVLKTPTVPNKSLKNLRFSPKPSTLMTDEVDEEKRPYSEESTKFNKIQRMSRKLDGKENSPNVRNIISAHYIASKNNKPNPKTASPQLYKLASKRASPGDVKQSAIFRNKMKKVVPKMRKNKDQNLDWFESDKLFGFQD